MISLANLETGVGITILAHADEPINLSDSKPVQDIGHKVLESIVLDSRDIFSALEIIRCSVLTTLASIIDNYVPRMLVLAAEAE